MRDCEALSSRLERGALGSYSVLGMAYSVRGAMACTRLSLEAERQSLGPPDLQLQAMLQWVNVLKLESTI